MQQILFTLGLKIIMIGLILFVFSIVIKKSKPLMKIGFITLMVGNILIVMTAIVRF